ncbi:Vitamin K-dependent protein S, partial [Ameca splendens]
MRRQKRALGKPLACLVLLVTLADAYRFLSQNTASQFLSRRRRANSLFEESKKGNLERECIEEVCNKEEAREIFENHPETEYFYPKYVLCLGSHRVGINHYSDSNIPPDLRTCVTEISNQCTPFPCYKEGSKRCIDGQASFTCECKPGWKGLRCED